MKTIKIDLEGQILAHKVDTECSDMHYSNSQYWYKLFRREIKQIMYDFRAKITNFGEICP